MWLLMSVVVVGVAIGAHSQCWDHPSCQALDSEASTVVTLPLTQTSSSETCLCLYGDRSPDLPTFLTPSPPQECVRRCRSDLTAETAVAPGNAHLQPQPQAEAVSFSLPPSSQAKRSYSMEHFRWGKPAGRKRRPVKVYASDGVEEDSTEAFPGEMRRELPNEPQEKEWEQEVMEEVEEEQRRLLAKAQEKKDAPYKMKHFRWSGPPISKRYGGFMKNWEDSNQRSLLTLFRNIINKNKWQE